ncbi:MAG TPA: phenylalanine--tRNA ligase subunit alpha [Thermomicrobiales bacterium]|nr:phenylalanine--tRNA ligase subunit alpha [Thermomicrobiales bacterium]
MATTTHGLSEKIDRVRAEATQQLEQIASPEAVQEWERTWIGPKGEITALLRSLGSLPKEERPDAGRETQALRKELEAAFAPVKERMEQQALEERLASEAVDVTLPGIEPRIGAIHPISTMIDELIEIFAQMGFQAVFGPEVETTRYNFDLLNIPADHPARDVWDTVIVDDPSGEIVLRTHTSPMQARTMERIDPPVRVIVPGAAYRYEAQDASHEWQLTQLEGLAVDEHITMTDLKGVLQEMARQLFGPQRKVRLRCDFFPFVEPGVDFAVDCAICNGKGCRVCKHTGWLEMGGAGMVHPNVLRGVGYDPEKYTGFAFGLGIERLVMMKYGVDDIRAFASNDLRFLKKFAAAAV